jgi:hypothetical protein
MTQIEQLRKEEVINRISRLKEMDNYIRNNIEDETNFYYWLSDGVPDQCDDDTYMFIATDTNSYFDILETFAICVLNQDDEEE